MGGVGAVVEVGAVVVVDASVLEVDESACVVDVESPPSGGVVVLVASGAVVVVVGIGWPSASR